MTAASRLALIASPLTIANVLAWGFYVRDPYMAAAFAALGGVMAWLADWSER